MKVSKEVRRVRIEIDAPEVEEAKEKVEKLIESARELAGKGLNVKIHASLSHEATEREESG